MTGYHSCDFWVLNSLIRYLIPRRSGHFSEWLTRSGLFARFDEAIKQAAISAQIVDSSPVSAPKTAQESEDKYALEIWPDTPDALERYIFSLDESENTRKTSAIAIPRL